MPAKDYRTKGNGHRSGLIEARKRPFIEPDISPEERNAVERAAEAYIAVAQLTKEDPGKTPKGRTGYPERTAWQLLDAVARTERHWVELANIVVDLAYNLRPDLIKSDKDMVERNRENARGVVRRNAALRGAGKLTVRKRKDLSPTKTEKAVAAWREHPDATWAEIAAQVGCSKNTATRSKAFVRRNYPDVFHVDGGREPTVYY